MKKRLDFSGVLLYNVPVTFAGMMELADVLDSKSSGSDTVRVRPPLPAPEKLLVLSNKEFFSYIRLRRVILLRSDIRLTPSDIALRAVKGEYNITFANSKNITMPQGIISLCA